MLDEVKQKKQKETKKHIYIDEVRRMNQDKIISLYLT